ncbi:MAG: hypothetical protein ACI8RZ_007282 [Myxococcota bacterium]|jgi:hypothetical protein
MNTVWMDRLGSVASAACAAHCFVLAAIPSIISVLGLNALTHEAFEWGFFTLAVGCALVAAVLGYRIHRTRWLLTGFGVGVLVLLAGRLGEALALYEGGAFLAVLGGGLLATSHVVSLRQTREQACCP